MTNRLIVCVVLSRSNILYILYYSIIHWYNVVYFLWCYRSELLYEQQALSERWYMYEHRTRVVYMYMSCRIYRGEL